MTYEYPPQESYLTGLAPQSPRRRNVLGIVALIAATIGLVFACIPGALVVGWVLLPVAFVLGIVGLFLPGKTKASSIAAVCVSIVGTVVGVVVFFVVVAKSFEETFNEPALSAAPSPPAVGTGGEKTLSVPGSRANPLSIGQPVSNEKWTVVIGQPREAWSLIEAENLYNNPPEPGMEFWMVPVRAAYKGTATGNAAWEVFVKFVGSDNRTYEDGCGVISDPLTGVGELYPGGVAEGNVCVAVPAGADGLWTVTTGFGKPVFFESGQG